MTNTSEGEEPRETQNKSPWLGDYFDKRDKRILKSKEELKEICAALFKVGVTRVEVIYDGYGDSGSIEQVSFFKGKKILTSKDVEYTIESKIEECAYDFLPGGFEINEGSFGDLIINTEKAKATLRHNTRVESSEYSEMRYDLASQEGPPRPPLISDTV